MKRGVSPLIAYVFLVALAVSIGMMVTSTLIERARNIDLNEEIEYCNDISIALKGVCKSLGVLEMNVSNNGAFSIYKVTLGKETNVSSYQWCVYQDPASFLPIKPGEVKQIMLSLNASFFSSVNGTLPMCHDTDNGIVSAAEISVVPWIKPDPEGELVACTNQKIVWSKDLNVVC